MKTGDHSFCDFKHNNKGRFLEACLLCLLAEEESYGYNLMENLSDFGFIEKEVDISTIYRTLRTMEKENLVTSLWLESDQGPKKRLYKVTDLGKEELHHWINFLGTRKNRIALIIEKYHSL